MDTVFLSDLIRKFYREDVELYIADENARIIACSNTDRIGTIGNTARYIITIRQAASIQDTSGIYDSLSHYGVPVMLYDSVEFVVVVYGNSSYAIQIGNTLQTALQTALEYQEYTRQKSRHPRDELERISELLLSNKSDKRMLSSLMLKHELDPNLLRCVIDINLNFYQNKFFNINLNLGYEASIEILRNDIINSLRKCKFLNTQDLVYSPDRNTILVIKSFIKPDDTAKVYMAVEEVCKDFMHILNRFDGLSFSIAYGNFYDNLEDIPMSWNEATEMQNLGRISGNKGFYSLDELLLDCVSLHLLPQIKNKYITPAEKKLFDKKWQANLNLLETAEAFVDNCLNITAAANQLDMHRNTVNVHLKQFFHLTGLNPASSFRDAFLTKMLALSIRRERYSQAAETHKETGKAS